MLLSYVRAAFSPPLPLRGATINQWKLATALPCGRRRPSSRIGRTMSSLARPTRTGSSAGPRRTAYGNGSTGYSGGGGDHRYGANGLSDGVFRGEILCNRALNMANIAAIGVSTSHSQISRAERRLD